MFEILGFNRGMWKGPLGAHHLEKIHQKKNINPKASTIKMNKEIINILV
jgi:hypothetical protein